MTGGALRPEEQRSQSETTPEILGVDRIVSSHSPLERAERLVARWYTELALRMPNTVPIAEAYIVFTNDVRDRMRDDIAALLNETISREHI